MTKLLVLSVVLLVGLVPSAAAQEGEPAPAPEEPAPEPLPEVPAVVPDMALGVFAPARRSLRARTVAANVRRCRPVVHRFTRPAWQIRADRRAETLAHWRHHLARARGQVANCSPRAIGQAMAAARGWTGAQWDALNAIWSQESGWNPCSHYPSTRDCGYGPFPGGGGSACGIPQFVPCSKLIGYSRELGDVSVREQIQKGLNYIAGRYGSPLGAQAHKRATGWY